jgi:hypothetical protein
MQITFGIGNDAAEPKKGELLGFVFTCPSCHTPVSYQANESSAVKLDKRTFENFKQAVKLEAAAFTKQSEATAVASKRASEDMFSSMLKDIRECESYDEFLKRIER